MNLSIPNLLQVALDKIIAQVTAITNSRAVVVAGGCLRDSVNGVPIKDIDVFVRSDVDAHTFLTLLSLEYPGAKIQFNLSYSSSEIHMVYDLGVDVDGSPVQLIQLKNGDTIEEITNRIDIGLCQISYGPNGLYYTGAFLQDFLNNTFTVVNCREESAVARTEGRIERLSKKYPGRKAVWPPEFLHMGHTTYA